MGVEVFRRRASGLVREASLLDVFALGFLNQGPALSFWMVTSFQIYIWPGADIILSAIIAGIWCTVGHALVWGLLGAAMPRSGGSYVYVSRIINPFVGLVVSMFNGFFVPCMWLWTLAPLYSTPGLAAIFGAAGMSKLAAMFEKRIVMYIVASAAITFGFIVGIMPLRIYNKVQKVFMTLTLITTLWTIALYLPHSRESFIAAWNAVAAKYNSLSYHEMIEAVKATGFEVPSTTNWRDTFALAVTGHSWWATYGFIITFICGEVKSPRRNVLLGQTLSVIVPTIEVALLGYGLQHCLGREFLVAAAYVDTMGGLEGYNMPFLPNFATIGPFLWVKSAALRGFLASCINWSTLMWMPMQWLSMPRAVFAWSMDRLGPAWFAELHPKLGTPVKSSTLLYVMAMAVEVGYIFEPRLAHALGGLGVTLGQFLFPWPIVAIACMIFPYRKKVRDIWEAAPAKWHIGPIYIHTIAGLLNLLYFVCGAYCFLSCPELSGTWQLWIPIYIACIVIGIVWYQYWKKKAAEEGIDISLAFKVLPPE